MKKISEMTEEEILDEALKGIPEYVAGLGRLGEFSEEDCMRRCIVRVKDLYRRSETPGAWQKNRSLTAAQIEELTQLCLQLDTPIRSRIIPVQEKYLKEKAIYQINSTTAQALISAAIKEIGLEAKVSGQKYRARVEVTLPKDARLRFYLRYKDLQKPGAVDGVVNAVANLKDELVCPGVTFVKKKTDGALIIPPVM